MKIDYRRSWLDSDFPVDEPLALPDDILAKACFRLSAPALLNLPLMMSADATLRVCL
jgi:hypothetical protein